MTAQKPAPEQAALTEGVLDPEDVRRATELLQAIADDRALLASLPLAARQALLIAAGRASRPESFQEKRLVKALRKGRRRRDESADREARATTGIRAAREGVFVAPARALPGEAAEAPRATLKKPKTCYVCKEDFTVLHHFYDALCPPCGVLNYEKRFQTASL